MVLILFVRTTCPKCEQAHELLEQINDENVITADPECYAMEVDIDEDFNGLPRPACIRCCRLRALRFIRI